MHVILDTPRAIPKSARILLEPEKSLNHFRRECSKIFNIDVVSVFLPVGQLVTDTADLKLARYVIVSSHFNLHNLQLIQEKKVVEESSASTDCFESKQTLIDVEFMSHPKAGKTTLIQIFIHESSQRESNLVIEAVFKKKLDIQLTTVEFAITDAVELPELPENDLLRRLKDKHAIVITCSKEKIIDAWIAESLDLLETWLLDSLDKIRLINPAAFVCLAITKFDLSCEFESQINEFLDKIAEKVTILRVSIRDDVLGQDVINPSQLFVILGENVCNNFLKKHRSLLIKRSKYLTLTPFQNSVPVVNWYDRLKRMFLCMSQF